MAIDDHTARISVSAKKSASGLRLTVAALVERALKVVAVPTGAIAAGGGMAHEVQGHGPAR